MKERANVLLHSSLRAQIQHYQLGYPCTRRISEKHDRTVVFLLG